MGEQTVYLMAYFTDEQQAFFLAQSTNLQDWTELNRGQPLLDVRSEGKRIRDPFLFQDQEGVFHLLFTDDWHSTTIGYSQSRDLKSWTKPSYLTLFEEPADVHNCWAPECFFERETGSYVLLWSTSFRSQNVEREESNRIYCCKTKDFQSFTEPQLFFDPGYVVIDATVCPSAGQYYMAFKDEREFNAPSSRHSAIRTAVSRDLQSFESISPLLTPPCSEGPFILYEKERFYLFFDAFGRQTYGVLQSDDFVQWEEISDRFRFPDRCKHFSILKVSN